MKENINKMLERGITVDKISSRSSHMKEGTKKVFIID